MKNKLLLIWILVFIVCSSSVSAWAGGISTCIAEDLSAKGAWNTACQGTYPAACGSGGDRLRCNDAITEAHTSRRSGSTYYYAGIRIKQYNSSLNNCLLISSVKICYEWWGDGTKSDCSIKVDANGGASWSTVTTTCPGATANPGVTCTDVSSLETWVCSNFFGASGTRAEAFAELTTTNNNLDRIQYWDAFYFNVTYEPNSTPDLKMQWLDPDKDEQNRQNNLAAEIQQEDSLVSFIQTFFGSIFSMFAN